MHILDIIIPTYNNYSFLRPCLESLLVTMGSTEIVKIYVINNGDPRSCEFINHPCIEVVNTGENKGWEGGLVEGLSRSTAPYVLFLNDDTFFPLSSLGWAQALIQNFKYEGVGAVGPSSNVVMGEQSVFAHSPGVRMVVPYLIGFCMMVSREALDKAGGIDQSLPGGDDLDLSIRLRLAGYSLITDKGVFVYHHGFKTGNRLYGDHSVSGGWNSVEHTEKINHALITKHGYRNWASLWLSNKKAAFTELSDIEGDIVKSFVLGETVLDIGCGPRKTVSRAIGIDMIPAGQPIPTLDGEVSVADVVHDISRNLPFVAGFADTIIARHILEHLIDPIKALNDWTTVLKPGGRLILALPDEDKFKTMVVNPEHVHAYTKRSAKNLLLSFGLKVTHCEDSGNGISFIIVGDKP